MISNWQEIVDSEGVFLSFSCQTSSRPVAAPQFERVDLDAIEFAAPGDDEQFREINSALDELSALAPEKAEVVKLRFFVGLDEKETAELLQISPRTVERYWRYAKAWLFDRIKTKCRVPGNAELIC